MRSQSILKNKKSVFVCVWGGCFYIYQISSFLSIQSELCTFPRIFNYISRCFVYFNLIYQKGKNSLPHSLEEFRKDKYEPKSLLARVHSYQAEREGSFMGKWSCLKCQTPAKSITGSQKLSVPSLPSQTQMVGLSTEVLASSSLITPLGSEKNGFLYSWHKGISIPGGVTRFQ